MHCSCCGLQKGMSWAEVMLNREEIKTLVLIIVELKVSVNKVVS